jgi:hypothetical protein
VLAFLGLEVLVFQALAWTNPAHGLALLPGTSVDALGFHNEAYGPAFWAHAAVAYVIIAFSVALLAREFLDSSGVRREQVGVFLASMSAPLALNVLYVFRLQPLDFTLTPVGFFVAEVGFAWARYRTVPGSTSQTTAPASPRPTARRCSNRATRPETRGRGSGSPSSAKSPTRTAGRSP